MTRQKLLYWCINTWKSRFSHDATEKKCTFDALLRFVPVFLMTRQNSYIRSRFSHDVPKTLIFVALIRGKAGFLMT